MAVMGERPKKNSSAAETVIVDDVIYCDVCSMNGEAIDSFQTIGLQCPAGRAVPASDLFSQVRDISYYEKLARKLPA